MSGLLDKARVGLVRYLTKPERLAGLENRLESLEKAVELLRHQRTALVEFIEQASRLEARLRMREVRAMNGAKGQAEPFRWHGSMLDESGG
jgi:response regulator of citrate/malate metabolism